MTKQQRIKHHIIKHYGGACACCGESNNAFLTLDHIDNDGAECRYAGSKRRRTGHALYLYLMRENYPQNIRVLCFNCNIGRHNNGGVCPHIPRLRA